MIKRRLNLNANTSLKIAATLLAMISGTAVLAESQTEQDPMAEAQAFLSSPTSMAQAIAAVEAATGGKVSGIRYQNGANGVPDLIMASVILADGTEKSVALNPADGKVMTVTVAAADMSNGQNDSENEGDNGTDTGETETGNN